MSSDTTSLPAKRPYVGVGVLVWKGDKLLLGKRLGTQGNVVWQFPGGHLEIDETVTVCAQREVREETGLEITQMQQVGFTDELFVMSHRHYVTLFISAAYISGEAEVLEPEKCQTWQWFAYDDLPQPLFQPINNLLKQIPALNVLQVGQGTPTDGHK